MGRDDPGSQEKRAGAVGFHAQFLPNCVAFQGYSSPLLPSVDRLDRPCLIRSNIRYLFL